MSYLGTFSHSIDNNNRLVIPSSFREAIGTEFVLLKSPDNCVFVYDKETFDGLLSQATQFTNTQEGRRQLRTLTRAARNVTQDKQGRFTVPADYIEFASLQNGVAITGAGNHFELWSQAAYDAQQAEETFAPESFPPIFF